MEEFYYVINGEGTALVNDETSAIRKDDVVPIRLDDVQSFANTGSDDLEFLVVGVAREKGKLDTVDMK